MKKAELQTELERAYRALRGIYGKIANGEQPNDAMLAYHSLTLGAAMRFVDTGELDGSEYFIGKPVDVLHAELAKYRK
jgi:hypothetical protein